MADYSSAAAMATKDMVASKLGAWINLADAPSLSAVSLMIYEVMSEIERCLKVRYRAIQSSQLVDLEEIDANETWANVGKDDFYRMPEKSLIADLVCMQWLFKKSLEYNQTQGSTAPTFLKKSKAGSVEAEYDNAEGKNIPLSMSISAQMDMFRREAIRKATNLKCVLDICEDCTFQAYLKNPSAFTNPSFLVVRSNCR